MEITGIKYTAPILDNSGYAQASRGNILALNSLGVPLTLNPISFETAHPDLGRHGDIIRGLVNKEIDYNINLIHTTPEFWADHREEGKINIGYSIWETTKLHPDWPKFINESVDALMVGCEWNVGVFRDSGVTVPIFTVPHGIDKDAFEGIEPFNIKGVDSEAYILYSIFQWCYDEETRVLTRNGFKYFKDLEYSDEVATLNKQTEELEYHKPEKIVKFRRKGPMMSLTGQQFDVCVTPDHKMVTKEHVKGSYKVDPNEDWSLIPLNEMIVKNKKGDKIISSKYRAKKNCKWLAGNDEDFFVIPGVDGSNYPVRKGKPTKIKMDTFLKFMGWYLSEGSLEISKNYYRIAITQMKDEKNIEEIFKCVRDMGFTPIDHGKDILFNSRELCLYLSKFGKCNDKYIPKWAKNLSSRQIKILLTSLFKGDGSCHKNGTWCKYVTTSKKLAEDTQECLLKIGLSGAVSICDPTKKTPGEIDGRTIQGKLLQYTVSVNRESNEPSMHYAELKEIPYDGYVHCVTVKNHTMLVERNGKVLFSGNTERKHPLALIKAYWYAFQKGENVALVLKTYRSDYSESERDAIRSTIRRMKQVTPMDNYPPIYLILNMLSEDEMLGLHSRGDCYVSLDRGEGFGLSPFTAGACGNPIIVTGFGGSTEYAKPDNSYLVDYSLTPCFGMPWSGSPIISIGCIDKYKKIKDISEGDLVFNKNGNIKKVIKVADRPMLSDEKMHSIMHYSMPSAIEVTNKHKLYVSRSDNIMLSEAKDITTDDYLVIPRPSLFSKEISINMLDYAVDNKWIEKDGRVTYVRDTEKSNGIYKNITLSEGLFYLIGLYLAEGCVYSSNSCVSFSFNSNEIGTLAKRCKECLMSVFGISEDHFYEREYENRKGYELIVSNTLVGRFFKGEFGSGSHSKFIPYRWRLNKNSDYRQQLIMGYWDGDGHIRKKGMRGGKNLQSPECVAETASKDLFLAIRDVLISLNILPSARKSIRRDGRVSYILSVSDPEFDSLFGILANRRVSHLHRIKKDTHFLVRVKSNSIIEDYDEPVYSMSVEPDDDEDIINGGSYILNGIASSNSPWYRGDQLWAEPDVKHGADTMKHVFENQEEAKEIGKRMQKSIYDNFAWEIIGQKIIDGIRSI